MSQTPSQQSHLESSAPAQPEEAAHATDKISKAEKRIAANVFDLEAWSILLRDAQAKKVEEARDIYERFLTQCPNSGRYWKIYIEHEMKAKNYEKVEKLFQRCLIKVLNIDLWKTYLTYIKETKGSLPSYREKMAQAYDFALDKIGMDIQAFTLWSEYINFLKSVKAVGSYAENQRISAVRKVYHKGIINPMTNIEVLWKEYCTFEHEVNPLIAKKMQEDKARDYMNSRRVSKEYEVVTKGLNRHAPCLPPQNTPDELKQVELWKKYIAWEKGNPLRTEDYTTITKRVMFAYEQCLLCLGYHPDIWIEASSFLEQSSKLLIDKGDQNAGKLFGDEASSMYERAISSLLKNNMLVYFAYADFEESRMKYEKVNSIYKRLIACEDIDPTLAYIQYMNFARRTEGIKAARIVFKLAREDARSRHHVFIAAGQMEYFCPKEKTIGFKIFELGLKKFGEHPDYVLAYIDYMSHMNEDNNTRVLFERILTSGQLPSEKQHDVWNKYLEFESGVGDLVSIQKVEKRRSQVIGKDYEGKETAMLIDRYMFRDLYPCSAAELKSLGYKDSSRVASFGSVVSQSDLTTKSAIFDEEEDDSRIKYPKPDVEQMMPFKPRLLPTGSSTVPGGIFAPPPAALDVLLKLPPPMCFNGPFVLIDKFIDYMNNLQLPNELPKSENGVSETKEIDRGTQLSIDVATGRKRKMDSGHESDDEDSLAPPPAHDIYRNRQQKKVK